MTGKKAARKSTKRLPVLVTGGAGYIGSHACKTLYSNGFLPIVYDNLSTGNRSAVKWGPFIKGDVGNEALLTKTIRKHKPVAVMHFAALISVGDSVINPQKYYENNVGGSTTLLRVAMKEKVKHFIFSSSAAVYGIAKKIPVKEDAPADPINPYGETKLMIEWIIRAYGEAYGLSYIAYRYFNAAGADAAGETGSQQKEPLNLIPIIVDLLKGKRKSFSVFGSDYKTSDGTAIRDYIHVSDVAEAHVKGLQYLLKGGKSATINLGTGKGHSVLEVVRAMELATRKKIRYTLAERRKGDPAVLIADNRLAAKLLRWKPKHSSLENITRTAWQWAEKKKVR